MVPMQSIDVPFAAKMVSSGGVHMLPTSVFICLRKSSPATVASAPVGPIRCRLGLSNETIVSIVVNVYVNDRSPAPLFVSDNV